MEWRQRVDPASPTRLLTCGDWVFRTDWTRRSADLGAVQASVAAASALSQVVGVWHPLKAWFVVRAEGVYWPCTMTPLLRTTDDLARVTAPGQRAARRVVIAVRWWVGMLYLTARTLVRHGLVLDIRPSNFGLDQRCGRLFYLDDEIYSVDRIEDIVHFERWQRLP